MGRPGTSSGRSHSSGGHSSHRASGGHRVGSSSSTSRAMRTSSSSSRSSGSSFGESSLFGSSSSSRPNKSMTPPPVHMAPPPPPRPIMPPPPPRTRRYDDPYITHPVTHHETVVHHVYDEQPRRSTSYSSTYSSNSHESEQKPKSIVGYVLLILAIAVVFLIVGNVYFNSAKRNSNLTVTRTALENPSAYDNNNVIDQLGWVENAAELSSKLQHFYDKTGIVPYIIMKDYDSSLTTDDQKNAYAENWYDNNIKDEKSFLYMYFAESDPDEVGYMAYVAGMEVSSIMDATAIDIFWSNIDRYWVDGDLTMNEVFIRAFNKTADAIMKPAKSASSITWMQVAYSILIIFIAGVLIIVLVLMKINRDIAAETERILSTPLEELSSDDEILNKYS